MVGFAGSADLYAVHKCVPLSASSSCFLLFASVLDRSFTANSDRSVATLLFLNFTLMFLSHEHLRSLVTVVQT